MIKASDTFDGRFPFQARFNGPDGRRVHYVDEGAGDPVLLLHGLPTWSFLYRDIIPLLSERNRVVAPDYLGFGKSDTPKDVEYTVSYHIDALEALLLSLDLRDVTLVLHDWGGMMGTGLALRHPDRIKRLVVMNTFMPLGRDIEQELLPQHNQRSNWFSWADAAESRGDLSVMMENLDFNILSLMQRAGLQDLSAIDEHWVDAYARPFMGACEGRAAYAFPRSIVRNTIAFEPPTEHSLNAILSKPAMMIYGMKDKALLSEYMIPIFRDAFPNSPIYPLANAGHYCQEDAPETIGLLIRQFIDLT